MDERAAIQTTIPGPWGPFHVAATVRGVVAVGWLTTDDAFEADLMRRLGVPVDDAGPAAPRPADDDPRRAHLVAATAALEALLAGRPPEDDLRFDLTDRPAWDRHVLAAVAGVPWGSTVSYGEIARRVGSPRAARAVGGAVGRNPIGLLIPCHRVIGADGTIGGYGGDAWGSREDRLAIKRELLLREGVTVAASAR
jgi:methylated-DNA-[protein]-cysteine S-methyltransferase